MKQFLFKSFIIICAIVGTLLLLSDLAFAKDQPASTTFPNKIEWKIVSIDETNIISYDSANITKTSAYANVWMKRKYFKIQQTDETVYNRRINLLKIMCKENTWGIEEIIDFLNDKVTYQSTEPFLTGFDPIVPNTVIDFIKNQVCS